MGYWKLHSCIDFANAALQIFATSDFDGRMSVYGRIIYEVCRMFAPAVCILGIIAALAYWWPTFTKRLLALYACFWGVIIVFFEAYFPLHGLNDYRLTSPILAIAIALLIHFTQEKRNIASLRNRKQACRDTFRREHAPAKSFLDEIRKRFPEIAKDVDGKEESPYAAMDALIDWLDLKGENGFEATICQRVVDFANWCEMQPPGENASDDTYTIMIVAMHEGLFRHQYTKGLIPQLMSKTDLEASKPYFVSWVGQDNYDKTLEQFEN
jgi:hypothetical protein